MAFCKGYSRWGIFKNGLPCLAFAKKGSKYCAVHSRQEVPSDCMICYNPMFKPFEFECGHKVCEECAVNMTKTVNEQQPLCKCPLCRTPTFRITEHVLCVKERVKRYKQYIEEYARYGRITLGPNPCAQRHGNAATREFYYYLDDIFYHSWIFVHDVQLDVCIHKSFMRLKENKKIVKHKYLKLYRKIHRMYAREFFNRIKDFLPEDLKKQCDQDITQMELT